MHLVDFITDVLMFIFTSIVLIKIDPVLAAVTLLPFPAIAWLVHDVRTRLRHGFARATNAWGDMVSVLTDAIPGVRVVKAFAQESREIDRFRQADKHVLDSNVKVNRLWSFFGPTVTLLTEISVLVIWAFGIWRVSSGSITVGVLTAFLAYTTRFYLRLDSMSHMLANTQRAAASAYRIFEILRQNPQRQRTGQTAAVWAFKRPPQRQRRFLQIWEPTSSEKHQPGYQPRRTDWPGRTERFW